jgi:diguanylate cyclase (GGDEF)-like protein
VRRTTAVSALLVAAGLVVALGLQLHHTQAEGRKTLRQALDRRATLTARLIGSAFSASTNPAAARRLFGGPASTLPGAARRDAAGSPDARVAVLDANGRVLAAAPAHDPTLVRGAYVRRALRGTPALSDRLRDRHGHDVVDYAVPFTATGGARRVLVVGGPVSIVRNFAAGFFASASALRRSEGYLIDGAGRPLAGTTGPSAHPRAPNRAVSSALARSPAGNYGNRTYVAAGVPTSRWRVVLTVPSSALYASVDGAPRRAAWELFAAFTAAILALLGLGVGAARGARRLSASIEREHAARRLAHERLHDPVTGLPNRTLFQDRVEHALAAARRHGHAIAVLFLDMDDFKRVNDSLGHDAGDVVLREVAARVTGALRHADTVSRFGGDEFVVLCEDIEHGDALRLAARIQDSLQAPVIVDDRQIPVSASIGVSVGGNGDTPSGGDVVRDADVAMYRAKKRARGSIEVFDAALHRESIARLDAEVALRDAIANGELVVHYQPIVSLPGGALHGVEALVRWRRPTGELVGPDKFIPLAEDSGLIVELGDWVLRAALRETGDWARRGLIDDGFELHVNVSAVQLADTGLPGAVARALESWGRAPGRLCLEITESAAMADPVATQRTLERLHALTVTLAIDDFGVGHSSLGQLARVMPISILKLDRSFVAGMDGSRDRSIVEAAASLARALGLSSVAEGVESGEQAGALADMGFSYAQGFHFGRPVAGADMERRLGAITT